MIKFKCTCGQSIKMPDEHAGKKAKCPKCKTVITRKTRDWQAEDKMTQYLTPETLFRKSKFDKYHGECVAA